VKVTGIICSPRKNGNSEVLVREILKSGGFEDVEMFYANEMHIMGCQACYYCDEHGECAVQDDMQKIYEAIEKADVVAFGAPVYMFGLTGQFKLVLDRLFAFLGPAPEFKSRLPVGKKAVLVVPQGYEDSREYETHIDQMKNAIATVGFEEVKVLSAPGLNAPGEASTLPDLMEEAKKIGQSLSHA